jgi:hypothetical protein
MTTEIGRTLGASLLVIGMLWGSSSPAPGSEPEAPEVTAVERRYCTQFGPFFVRFDPDKAAGVFAIHMNGDLGSMVGTLDGHELEGIWVENDSRGRIRMSFSGDWSTFEAEYSVESEPESWRGGWLGRLPRDDVEEFEHEGLTYRCR